MNYNIKKSVCQVKNSGSCISSVGDGVRLPTHDQSEGVIQEPVLISPSDGRESRRLGGASESGERMRDVFGDWLCGFPWEWFVTLTFKYDRVGIFWADKRWQKWIKTLRREIGRRVEFTRVSEWQTREIIHFHALMLNTDGYSRYKAMKLWENTGNGYARIYPCEKAASYYVAKYITKKYVDIRFSRCIRKYRQENFNEFYNDVLASQPALKQFDLEVVKVGNFKSS